MTRLLNLLGGTFRTVRLALPKIGIGWMFALLTMDFNRAAIHELSISAVLVTTLLSLHYFLSPFQVIAGRFTDRHPLFGLRRTPYLLAASVAASLIFLALPTAAFGMGAGSVAAFALGFALLVVFGIGIAVHGDTHHALIAERTEPHERGGVIAVVWIVLILSGIFSAVVMNIVAPEFSAESMTRLYSLTPLIVITTTLLGVIGMEKRLSPAEHRAALDQASALTTGGNPLAVASRLLRENQQTRTFFAFMFVAILAIFLQDNILEPFGAEVFDLPQTETRQFQPAWGGGVLIGMLLMGVVSTVFRVSKQRIALIGSVGTAVGLALLAVVALTQQAAAVRPVLMLMGLFTGFFNVGALSMMMDMTVAGATGLYMGLWGMAQAFGNGVASIGGGALHTGLIESNLLAPHTAYFAIFSLEAVGMVVAAILLARVSVAAFQAGQTTPVTRADAVVAMEAGVV